ncbi:MAG TPA: hypothetical protein VFM18_16605 [Methanosarcina sp.]|nr:hypothetical protein [Methanosarcina sp.]
MHQFMKIAGYTIAALGVAYVIKYVKHSKESSRGWHKIKVEDEVKRTGSRYGSNPVRY